MARAVPANQNSIIPRKQRATHEQFVSALANIERLVPREEFEDLLRRTVDDVEYHCAKKRAHYGWSGGKDSMALQLVCQKAGLTQCVLGMTDLEYPAFLRWVTEHMPDGLTVINTGLDYEWLRSNPQMLFPNTDNAARWFAQVQHRAQRQYLRQEALDVLVLGRREADGNFMGDNGDGMYVSGGIVRFSPLQYWRHEDVLAACYYYQLPFAPNYSWPRGFRVGTGSWPARQWCPTQEFGWDEVWSIDRSVVERARDESIPGAAEAVLRNSARMGA